MIRLLLAAASAGMLAACVASEPADVGATARAALPAVVTAAAAGQAARASSGEPPQELRMASSVGEVVFRHQAHVEERAIGCPECHHQINAKALATPHPEYLQSSWVNCKTCHDEAGAAKPVVYACSACHRTNPMHIADETLSAKVVVHRKCWKCHEVGSGPQASEACGTCHTGKKTT